MNGLEGGMGPYVKEPRTRQAPESPMETLGRVDAAYQEQVLRLMQQSLGGLSCMGQELSCLLVQEGLPVDGIKESMPDLTVNVVLPRAGFTELWTPKDAVACLLVVYGTDVSAARWALSALDRNEDCPVIIVVLVVSSDGYGTDEQTHMQKCYQIGVELQCVRQELYEDGAANVISLIDGEVLPPHRIAEVVHQSFIAARETRKAIERERKTLQEAAVKKLKSAYVRFLRDLPEHAHEGIPVEDPSLEERDDEDNKLAGFDSYNFMDLFGKGSFASVYRAVVEKKLQCAYNRTLRDLPGHALEGIPAEDPSLEERYDEDKRLVGFGSYDFKDLLGKGSFASVYRAGLFGDDAGELAIKVVSKASMTHLTTHTALNQEVTIMLNLQPHPNVVQAYFIKNSFRHFFVGMQYAGPMCLHAYTVQHLKQSEEKTLPPRKVLSFAKQQALAVQHLHRAMIAHRDLKPRNFIVSHDGEDLKLTDFGLAVQLSGACQRLFTSCGSLPFCAPEVVRRGARSDFGSIDHPPYLALNADMWSLGVNFIELSEGPYAAEALLRWVKQRSRGCLQVAESLSTLETLWLRKQESDCMVLHAVVASIVVVDPCRRLACDQLLSKLSCVA
mmetsp:Transcript_62327/g.160704  ORF Transcript_62327/g.160704 Transcript_62327/m.160704 type:complete len:615 (-) Transcript_62327:418-2262(-)